MADCGRYKVSYYGCQCSPFNLELTGTAFSIGIGIIPSTASVTQSTSGPILTGLHTQAVHTSRNRTNRYDAMIRRYAGSATIIISAFTKQKKTKPILLGPADHQGRISGLLARGRILSQESGNWPRSAMLCAWIDSAERQKEGAQNVMSYGSTQVSGKSLECV